MKKANKPGKKTNLKKTPTKKPTKAKKAAVFKKAVSGSYRDLMGAPSSRGGYLSGSHGGEGDPDVRVKIGCEHGDHGGEGDPDDWPKTR